VVRIDGRFEKTPFHHQGSHMAQYAGCGMSTVTS